MCGRVGGLFAAGFALPFILGFALGYGLPLHIAGRIGATASKRINMINYIALAWPFGCARGWAWVFALELNLGRLTTFNALPSVCARAAKH